MSGHSKWATIKRQKGAADAKRGQLFTKLSVAITIAAKDGLADPASNFKLRIAIDKARSANMPKDVIERAIQKAAGRETDTVEELVYEGFGPSGVSVVVETITDNKQRTFSEVKNIFDKNGGRLAGQGSVMYQFRRVGEITVKKNGKLPEDLLEIALESGADDIDDTEDMAFFYTDPMLLFEVKKSLEEKGLIVENAELVFKPLSPVVLSEEAQKQVFNFMEKLEDLADVHKTATNLA